MFRTGSPKILGPDDGQSVTLEPAGARFMIPVADTKARFTLLEHPLPPRALGSPLHRHSREDEYGSVLEGRLGTLLGEGARFGVCFPGVERVPASSARTARDARAETQRERRSSQGRQGPAAGSRA